MTHSVVQSGSQRSGIVFSLFGTNLERSPESLIDLWDWRVFDDITQNVWLERRKLKFIFCIEDYRIMLNTEFLGSHYILTALRLRTV